MRTTEKRINNYEISENRPTEAGRSRLLSIKRKECGHCFKKFEVRGTRQYCSEDCKNAEKRNRQKLVDDLGAKIKKGLYANFKLFKEIQPNSGKIQIDYDNALKNGFDEHAYYGTYINAHNDLWRKVGDYYFTITHDNSNRMLHIFKK